MEAHQNGGDTKTPKWKIWLKRIGIAGFLFFLIKGLIWLAIFYFFGKSIFGGE